MKKRRLYHVITWFGLLLLLVSACTPNDIDLTTVPVNTDPAQETISPTETITPVPPSPTPAPMAVIVNGDGITIEEYQAELSRYQEAIGRELTQDDEQLVLSSMIDEVILAQAAAESGYLVTDQAVDQRITELGAKAGGEEFTNWLQRYGYDEAGFRRALARAMAAAWMRDEVTSEVPTSMEQVHVRQIFVTDRQEADQIFNRLQAGADFEAIAYEYDPVTRGELGWFPRGYLFEPLVESAAFELEVGQFSQVIESGLGFHILYQIERETDRTLLLDALQRLQAQYLSTWLESARQESDIQILIQ